ncbi:hypothetical protein K502DRAFT_326496 [Neoconidiobolus thromboides FSU 785]|nr:hypothetical protein K502DRAFT_326496 [Neoconidiobolus thromboides FSU 785]
MLPYSENKQKENPSNSNLLDDTSSYTSSHKTSNFHFGSKSPLPMHSFHSNSSKTSLTSNNLISPLNIHLANSLLSTGTTATNQGLFSNSVSNLVNAGVYTTAAVQKSLSSLDVKSMTRDISLVQDNLTLEENWPHLVIKVLPLFNGERLGGKIEELNENVRTCLKTTDLVTFSNNIYNGLLSAGMFTLSAKLSGIHEDKIATRVVELWSFFLGTVLPYLEGVFLPHQIEVNQLKRSKLTSVRTMTLNSFKIHVIAPLMNKLEVAIQQLFKDETQLPTYNNDIAAKLLQMMSILNMSPPLEEEQLQKQFNCISDLLKNKWKQNLNRA